MKSLRACLETMRGAVLGEKAGWRGATKENIPGGSSTEEQRSQTAFSAKTLRAAGLLPVAGVDSFLTARSGDARVSPPWAQPKSLAAAPLVVSKQALSRIMLRFACALLLGAAGAEAATFTVNTTNDTSDADLADGICADINGKCSLRAAIMQANYTNLIGTSNTIIVPAGVYTLTRPGDDDSAVIGDLDIAQPMTIQSAGSSRTIVDGNRAWTGRLAFKVSSLA